MLRQLIEYNDASVVYSCNIEQIERLIIEEKLNKTEIKKLREKLEEHSSKLESFKYVIRKLIL